MSTPSPSAAPEPGPATRALVRARAIQLSVLGLGARSPWRLSTSGPAGPRRCRPRCRSDGKPGWLVHPAGTTGRTTEGWQVLRLE